MCLSVETVGLLVCLSARALSVCRREATIRPDETQLRRCSSFYQKPSVQPLSYHEFGTSFFRTLPDQTLPEAEGLNIRLTGVSVTRYNPTLLNNRTCHPSSLNDASTLCRPFGHLKAAVADRLYASAEAQTALLKSREDARVAKELAACTFRPDTSESSKRCVIAAEVYARVTYLIFGRIYLAGVHDNFVLETELRLKHLLVCVLFPYSCRVPSFKHRARVEFFGRSAKSAPQLLCAGAGAPTCFKLLVEVRPSAPLTHSKPTAPTPHPVYPRPRTSVFPCIPPSDVSWSS